MYVGYNLEIESMDSGFLDAGKTLFMKYSKEIEIVLNDFTYSDGSLDGCKLRANWFPEIKADVFISHSHKDEELATAFAGWLYSNFKIKAFIDSCVWQYADDLLQSIDDDYCVNPNRRTYNYKKRNYSTSHVHMMLTVALADMMDRTECLFFLNTPESIIPSDTINQTWSPWIYTEIAMTKLIRKKEPREHRKIAAKTIKEEIEKILGIKHDVDLEHLLPIDMNFLNFWKKEASGMESSESLDILYKMSGL